MELLRHTGEQLDFGRGALHFLEQVAHLCERLLAARRAEGEELVNSIDLRAGKPQARDRAARFVLVADGQFQADLLVSKLVEFVEDAEYVMGPIVGDAGVREQEIQHAAARDADAEAADVQRLHRVAHGRDHLDVGDRGLDADRVDVELDELAEAAALLVGVVAAPRR